jgi:hypothetical protein
VWRYDARTAVKSSSTWHAKASKQARTSNLRCKTAHSSKAGTTNRTAPLVATMSTVKAPSPEPRAQSPEQSLLGHQPISSCACCCACSQHCRAHCSGHWQLCGLVLLPAIPPCCSCAPAFLCWVLQCVERHQLMVGQQPLVCLLSLLRCHLGTQRARGGGVSRKRLSSAYT